MSSLDAGKEARTASGIPIVPVFDGFRAVAIFGVVIYHVALFSGTLVRAGDNWFAIFLYGPVAQVVLTMLFIVSGFVLFLPVAARDGEFGSKSAFAIRRAARILPAYWVGLVLAFVILALISAIGPLPTLAQVGLHVTMLHTPALLFDPSFPLGFGVIASVWTLSVEAMFYVLLPFVARPYFRRPLLGLFLAAVIVIAWRLLATHIGDVGDAFGIDISAAAQERWETFYASQLPTWALAIAAGMTGAWAYVKLRERYSLQDLARPAAGVTLVALAASAGLAIVAGNDALADRDVLTGLFARESTLIALTLPFAVGTAMVGLALSPPLMQKPFAVGVMRWLGDVSYGIYLAHLAILLIVANELDLPNDGSVGDMLTWAAIVLPLSLLYGLFSVTAIERPARRWARRVVKGRVAPPRPAPSGGDGSEPAISIVIPTYNRADWLRGALDSVLTQDYANLEAFVVDDGSSDATQDVLRDYAEHYPPSRFRWMSQANAGQATALNRGNAEARGEILGYLSDDDALAPGAVGRLARELIADRGVAIAYPAYREFDGEGEITDTVRPVAYDSRAAWRLHDTVIGPGALARRDALEAAGGWDPELRWLGDLILWIKTGLSGRAVRVDEPLALWRKHDGSATIARSPEHAREHLRCVEIGLGLDDLQPIDRADHAEALRNACMFAALFSGDDAWPRDRFLAIDLHRRATSALGTKLGPGGEIDWSQVERGNDLYRELISIVIPDEATVGAGGLDEAYAQLGSAGLLPGSATALEPGAVVAPTLIEAAFACGTEIEPGEARFVICDLERARIDPAALAELGRLGFFASVADLESAIGRHAGKR